MVTHLFLAILTPALGVSAFGPAFGGGWCPPVRLSSTAALAKRERRTPRAPTPASRRERAPVVIERAPHQFDHTQEEARPFLADPMVAIKAQDPNEDAETYELKCSQGGVVQEERRLIAHSHVERYSLDELFPGLTFSETFNASPEFRNDLRDAMREDIFDTTPTYHGMSEKARKFLLMPDSSIQGSWKCKNGGWSWEDGGDKDGPRRMHRLTNVLRSHLGVGAPSGDDFMDTIGELCGGKPSTHWMDIVGVLNRRVPHAWKQDTGDSTGDRKTVLFGFPPENNYRGVGVFDHLVKLKYEEWASVPHAINEPVLYDSLDVPEEFIVRPVYKSGQEILVYRDVDVLYSNPDIAHRLSVMRFM